MTAPLPDTHRIVADYNQLNRLAYGPGVELEEGWKNEDHTLAREEFEALRQARTRERERGTGM